MPSAPTLIPLVAAVTSAPTPPPRPGGLPWPQRLEQSTRRLASAVWGGWSAAQVASRSGGSVETTYFQSDALVDADVVVAKSWGGFSGYGRRDAEATRREQLAHWRLDNEKMPYRGGFMHCLPVRRNVVATDDLLDGPRSWVHETAGNRMWTAMALLETLLDGAPSWNG